MAPKIMPCPTCGQQVRFPTNLGPLTVTCPNCTAKWPWNPEPPSSEREKPRESHFFSPERPGGQLIGWVFSLAAFGFIAWCLMTLFSPKQDVWTLEDQRRMEQFNARSKEHKRWEEEMQQIGEKKWREENPIMAEQFDRLMGRPSKSAP